MQTTGLVSLTKPALLSAYGILLANGYGIWHKRGFDSNFDPGESRKRAGYAYTLSSNLPYEPTTGSGFSLRSIYTGSSILKKIRDFKEIRRVWHLQQQYRRAIIRRKQIKREQEERTLQTDFSIPVQTHLYNSISFLRKIAKI